MGTIEAARTHCPRGHPYDEANTVRRNGRRHCRICARLLQRLRARGTTDDPVVVPMAVRFWAKVDKDGPVPAFRPDLGPCWLWIGAKRPGDYGQFTRTKGPGRRPEPAHRIAYELLLGPIPSGLHLDHLCRVHPCVNPSHLEPVTCRTNLLRGETFQAANAAKTHCPQGHPYEGDNLRVDPRGNRRCRACEREQSYAAFLRRRERGVVRVTVGGKRVYVTAQRTA